MVVSVVVGFRNMSISINIVVFIVVTAFCTKLSTVIFQVPTFTRLALLILSGGDRFKSRPEHRQF